MKAELAIKKSTVVHTFPEAWSPAELRQLLELAEFAELDTFADEEPLDVAVMVLQDLSHQRAGEVVLETVFGSTLSAG